MGIGVALIALGLFLIVVGWTGNQGALISAIRPGSTGSK